MTISYTLTGLAYGTTYTYDISGFKDVVGNEMAPIASGLSFSTESDPADFSCWFEGGDTYILGSNKVVVFVADKEIELHSYTTVDGTVLNTSQVVITPGSTKATLQASYLDTLSVDPHRIELHFTDGTYGYGTFEVKAGATSTTTTKQANPTNNPTALAKTSDTTNPLAPLTLCIMGFFVLGTRTALHIQKRLANTQGKK